MIPSEHIGEALSKTYIQAVAAQAGMKCESGNTEYGVDITLREIIYLYGKLRPGGFPIDCQLKSTINWELKDEKIVYDLRGKNYNDIVLREGGSPFILVLLCLPKDQSQWVELDEEQLRIRKCCYWTTLTGPPVKNDSTKRIFIPRERLVTPETLTDLMNKCKRGEL
jgi:hypothetical protein